MWLKSHWITPAARLGSCALALVASPALAQVDVVMGGNPLPVPVITTGVTGIPVAPALTGSFFDLRGTNRLAGTVTSIVYDRGEGRLDFWYQITSSNSNVALTGASPASFLDIRTAVGQISDADGTGTVFSSGTERAVEARRAGDGQGLVFSFGSPNNAFLNGETTYTLLVRTDATTFSRSTMGVVGSGVAATAAAYAPFNIDTGVQAIAPEPASFSLMALALLGIAARRRTRK